MSFDSTRGSLYRGMEDDPPLKYRSICQLRPSYSLNVSQPKVVVERDEALTRGESYAGLIPTFPDFYFEPGSIVVIIKTHCKEARRLLEECAKSVLEGMYGMFTNFVFLHKRCSIARHSKCCLQAALRRVPFVKLTSSKLAVQILLSYTNIGFTMTQFY